MKKLLALVLALIMVLGLGVTAFAADDVKLNVIVLKEDDDDDDEDPEVIETLEFDKLAEKKDTYLCDDADGGDFYFEIGKYDDLKNIEVSATGNVTAEIVEFDDETMRYPDAKYVIYDNDFTEGDYKKNPACTVNYYDGKDVKDGFNADQASWLISNADSKFKYTGKGTVKTWSDNAEDFIDEYDYLEYAAKKLNAVKGVQKNRFSVVCLKKVGDADATGFHYEKLEKHLLKVTVGENYSAAYKEGTVKVSAYDKNDKKDVVAELTIISDVTIFEYEEFKWAVDEGEALEIYTKGYSDYETAKKGYDINDNKKYDSDALRQAPNATVVSTTEFRYAEGEELELTAGDVITVTIDEVAKGQKGVNFACEGIYYYDEDDEKIKDADGENARELADLKGDVEYFEFGFLGNQVINSDFEIEVNLPWDAFELRELFGKKVEEEDIITYYVLKDGVKIDDFTVDYKDDDIDEKVELEILGKAGDKLGYYTITLDAPAAEEGEENPNTGAESVVGVVAAMAVVSLVAAAAVSLKK